MEPRKHITESTEFSSFGEAYRDFVKRCYTGHKPNYAEKAINFLLDCAHIANGTNVKGLPQQGFELTLAGNEDLVGDCLHLRYTETDGNKGVDVWLNPHTQKASVDLYGFNPEDPRSSTHKEFSARNYTADDFCDFIEGLPGYTVTEAKKTKAISCNALVSALKEKGLDVKEDLNGSYQVVARGDDFDTTDNLLFVTTMYPESTGDGDYISDSAFVRGRVNGNCIKTTDVLTSVEAIVSMCADAFGIKSESRFKGFTQKTESKLRIRIH